MWMDAALCLAVLIAVLDKMVQGTILCSICKSDDRKNCESQPPEPEPCPEMVEACAVVRISNKATGELNQFIRSCTNSNTSDCFDSLPGFITCAEICRTDGCNLARTLHVPLTAGYYLPVLLTLLRIRLGNG